MYARMSSRPMDGTKMATKWLCEQRTECVLLALGLAALGTSAGHAYHTCCLGQATLSGIIGAEI